MAAESQQVLWHLLLSLDGKRTRRDPQNGASEMRIVRDKKDPFWAPWYIRWAARLTVRWMARSQVQGYEVQGTDVVRHSDSHQVSINCDAMFLLHWVLRCCGHEVAPIDIEKNYLKNRRMTFEDEQLWTKWQSIRIIVNEFHREDPVGRKIRPSSRAQQSELPRRSQQS